MDRIGQLKETLLSNKPSICHERAVIATQAYKEFENEPAELLRAKTLKRVLESMSIYISEKELIVGNQASRPKAAPIFPEFSYEWVLDELNTFSTRRSDKFFVSEESKRVLKQVLPWWKNKTTKDKAQRLMPDASKDSNEEHVYILTSLSGGIGHVILDYESVLKKGFDKIKEEAKQYLETIDITCPESVEKRAFYKSIIITCEAVVAFAQRFSSKALELSQKETDQMRKRELIEISRICKKVPKHPAETFHEALQSFWFAHLVIHIESSGHSNSVARFDQYMYEYYYHDINKGFIDEECALELLCCLWIKFNELNKLRDKIGALAFGGYPMFQNLIVSGLDSHGNDATNELSYLCMQASEQISLPEPSFSVRYSNLTEEKFMNKACELTKKGNGMPAFYNDNAIIPALLGEGTTIEDARNYGIMGCVEPCVPGKTEGFFCGGFINLCKVLEITMNKGVNADNGTKYGEVITEKDFESYDSFFEAYKRQLIYFIRLQVAADNAIDLVHSRILPTPMISSMMKGCLENGKDIRQGGTKYNYVSINAVGLANVADSLAVIKHVIYEKKEMGWSELRNILDCNFEGFEDVRQHFINDIPKYGNDDDYVDLIAQKVANVWLTEGAKPKNIRKGTYRPGFQSISAHVLFAGSLGATPDGRKKEHLVADGGVSPAQGRDKKGPTAVIRSVAKLDHILARNGTLLNMKFTPAILEGDKGTRALAGIIRSYFNLNGCHIQFNIISTQNLRDAQKNPQNYSSLVVRVAGFCVFFTAVDKVLQDDIIERTEQGVS